METLFLYLPWLWLSTVIVGTCLVELLWCGVVVLRAADVGYHPERCASRRPVINLEKARRRRITWPRLGLPLFAICAALFITQLLWMTALTYTLISIGWFATGPFRKMWGVAAARRVRPSHIGYWTQIREYYSLGFALPRRPENQVWFIGKYRWLNKFQNFWYILQIYRFWAFPGYAIASLLWPIASAVSIFYHLDLAGRRDYLLPWWRLDRDLAIHPEPVAQPA